MPPEPLAVVAEQNATHVDTETKEIKYGEK